MIIPSITVLVVIAHTHHKQKATSKESDEKRSAKQKQKTKSNEQRTKRAESKGKKQNPQEKTKNPQMIRIPTKKTRTGACPINPCRRSQSVTSLLAAQSP